MILKIYKKTFAIIGIMAIMISSFFLIKPQKANATVPVYDSAAVTELTTMNTYLKTINTQTMQIQNNTGDGIGSVYKEMKAIRKKEVGMLSSETTGLSWDWVAYTAAGVALKAVTDSIVQWINNGFEGQPGFITDFDKYLQDALDQASGQFFKQFLSPSMQNAICSPFRAQLNLGLKTKSTFQQRMTCTLSSVMKNATDLSEGVRGGGWNTWLSVTANPQNNPYGAFITSVDEMFVGQALAKEQAKTESIFNAGFLSMKECAEYSTADAWTGKKTCIKYKSTSPGKWVESTLSQATGVDMQRLAVADEIDEILSALISQLLKSLLK